MYRHLELALEKRIRAFLRESYGLELAKIIIEQPPRVELGEYALPLAFELAKSLRKPPRKIAQEVVEGVGAVEGFRALEIAGAGYINARLDREVFASQLASDTRHGLGEPGGKVLVEHTSINPNKAAHIGHLRNAILGDTFVRLLRSAGKQVDVQNYIDNTGVQVADVVVGLLYLEHKSLAEVEVLAEQPRFDYYCWDLYAGAAQFYARSQTNLELRRQTLHEIEAGGNLASEMAETVSTAVLRRHLETMQRLGIEYDFLPRESEILHLRFWDAAFARLKDAGVLLFETEGKNKGCWVMRRAGARVPGAASDEELQVAAEQDQKVIVRSNGTVGYVGKDIAYHMWKFGVLGRDFGYRKFYRYPLGHDCWISTSEGVKEHPHFGDVAEIYNVIDARQAEAQNAVIEALRGLGYLTQADHYTHLSYEMVALTPACAIQLGYRLSDEDRTRPFLEVSGRKGFGVKADDLIDTLIAATRKEVDGRHPEVTEAERATLAAEIAIGALRFFMLKFTKPSVIAFDFKEALSFEGETGPYVQYAVVRAANILRKAGLDPDENFAQADDYGGYLTGSEGTEVWELWLAAGKTSYVIDQSIATAEPAYLARHAFQLAQRFNSFYHRFPVLNEAEEGRKKFLLATVIVVRRELKRVLAVMGIAVPALM